MNQTESALEAEIRALDAYQQKHNTCDIQRHPWHAVFGAGFAAGMAWERQTELENGLRAARRRAEEAEAEVRRLREALLEFIQAYANVERLDQDGTEVKLFTAWIRGCAVLGIKAEGHPQAEIGR